MWWVFQWGGGRTCLRLILISGIDLFSGRVLVMGGEWQWLWWKGWRVGVVRESFKEKGGTTFTLLLPMFVSEGTSLMRTGRDVGTDLPEQKTFRFLRIVWKGNPDPLYR